MKNGGIIMKLFIEVPEVFLRSYSEDHILGLWNSYLSACARSLKSNSSKPLQFFLRERLSRKEKKLFLSLLHKNLAKTRNKKGNQKAIDESIEEKLQNTAWEDLELGFHEILQIFDSTVSTSVTKSHQPPRTGGTARTPRKEVGIDD